jgi:hypothetical protein
MRRNLRNTTAPVIERASFSKPLWTRFKSTFRGEAISYVSKTLIAAVGAIFLFFVYRIETVIIPLLEATQLRTSITNFRNSAHSLSISEIRFLRAVQTADCNSQYFTQAAEYAINPHVNFDLTGTCTLHILTESEFAIRQMLIDTITLYASKLTLIASPDKSKILDRDSQARATRLNTLAKIGAIKTSADSAAVEAAIVALSGMAIDKISFTNSQSAAAAMAPYLVSVVAALKDENTALAASIPRKFALVEIELRAIVAASKMVKKQASFFDIIEARRIMQSLNPLGTSPLSPVPGMIEGSSDPENFAYQINSALDALVNANAAIAKTHVSTIQLAVGTLIDKAQEAQNARPGSAR